MTEFKAHVNPDYNLAFLTDPLSKVRVGTRVQAWGQKGAAIAAYTAARFSRHKGGVEQITKQIHDNAVDTAERLDKIVGDYGHSSVMALAPLSVSLEGISMYTAARVHYFLEPAYMSQEASTRYIDFSAFDFHPIEGCEAVIRQAQLVYAKLYDKTFNYLEEKYSIDCSNKKQKSALVARTFDCMRYLLPASLTTSMTIRADARVISGLIALLRDNPKERVIGDLLLALLTGNKELLALGYVPEADTLIRHTNHSTKRYDSDSAVLQYLQSFFPLSSSLGMEGGYCHAYQVSHDKDLVKNYLSLIYPKLKMSLADNQSDILSDEIARILYRYHDRHKMIGNKAQLGALMVEGVMDLGSMRDLNRHRSVNKVVPFLEKEGNKSIDKAYSICPYISKGSQLHDLFCHAIESIYKVVNRECARKYQRYNVPLAHNVHYRISGNIDAFAYICELRSRPGGHIAYRQIASQWADALSEMTWTCYHFKKLLSPVDRTSQSQFLDRS